MGKGEDMRWQGIEMGGPGRRRVSLLGEEVKLVCGDGNVIEFSIHLLKSSVAELERRRL